MRNKSNPFPTPYPQLTVARPLWPGADQGNHAGPLQRDLVERMASAVLWYMLSKYLYSCCSHGCDFMFDVFCELLINCQFYTDANISKEMFDQLERYSGNHQVLYQASSAFSCLKSAKASYEDWWGFEPLLDVGFAKDDI